MNSSDFVNIVWLIVYKAFIILYISRKVNEKFERYMARKTIHVFSAGVSLILSPFLFSSLLLREREKLDDNISVPFGSAVVMMVLGFL